jgi:anti-sigma factor RsiW
LLAQISDYLDGDLEDTICLELESHLVDCTDCQIVTDTLRKTISLFRRHGRVIPPEGLTERLRQALEAGGCVSPGR